MMKKSQKLQKSKKAKKREKKRKKNFFFFSHKALSEYVVFLCVLSVDSFL